MEYFFKDLFSCLAFLLFSSSVYDGRKSSSTQKLLPFLSQFVTYDFAILIDTQILGMELKIGKIVIEAKRTYRNAFYVLLFFTDLRYIGSYYTLSFARYV